MTTPLIHPKLELRALAGPKPRRDVALDLSAGSSKQVSPVEKLEAMADDYFRSATPVAQQASAPSVAPSRPESRAYSPVPAHWDGIALARQQLEGASRPSSSRVATPGHSTAIKPPVSTTPVSEAAPVHETWRKALIDVDKASRPARRAMIESVVVSAVIGGIVGTVIGCSHLGPFGLAVGITGIVLSLLFALPLGYINARMQQRALLQDPAVVESLKILRQAPEGLDKEELAKADGLLRFVDGHIFEQSKLPKWLKTAGQKTSRALKLDVWAAPPIQRVVLSRVDRLGDKLGKKTVELKARAEQARIELQALREQLAAEQAALQPSSAQRRSAADSESVDAEILRAAIPSRASNQEGSGADSLADDIRRARQLEISLANQMPQPVVTGPSPRRVELTGQRADVSQSDSSAETSLEDSLLSSAPTSGGSTAASSLRSTPELKPNKQR